MRNYIEFPKGAVVFYDQISAIQPLIGLASSEGSDSSYGDHMKLELKIYLNSGQNLEILVFLKPIVEVLGKSKSELETSVPENIGDICSKFSQVQASFARNLNLAIAQNEKSYVMNSFTSFLMEPVLL